MNRRTRWIRWARSTSKRRRRIYASAGIRRQYPKGDMRRWAVLEGYPGGIVFSSQKPNPFYGRRYPYKMQDGYLRAFVHVLTVTDEASEMVIPLCPVCGKPAPERAWCSKECEEYDEKGIRTD